MREGRSGPLIGGAIRIALLFGSLAVAFALLAAPLAERHTRERVASRGAGVDYTTTGSIRAAPRDNSYTVRRSVLQESPNAVCIIRADGQRSGRC